MESDLIYMILLIFASILLIILMYNFKRKQGSTLRTKEQTLLYTTYKSFIDNGYSKHGAIEATAGQLKISYKTISKYVDRIDQNILESPGKIRAREKFSKLTEFEHRAILTHMQFFS